MNNSPTVAPSPLLVLASASPRRQALLATLGYPFVVQPSQVDEEALTATLGGLPPRAIVQHLALAKAHDVATRLPSRLSHDVDAVWVIGADTTVDLDGIMLGKPTTPTAARALLRQLRGRTHVVHTGVAVLALRHLPQQGATAWSSLDERSLVISAEVDMRQYDNDEIDTYVTSGEPLDKAGAYAIQGLGANLVAGYRGSLHTVIGLPLDELRDLLVICECPS